MPIPTLADVAADLHEWATGDSPRIRTGFPVIDDLTRGGPAPGEVVMILGRSGVGKTAVGCNFAVNMQGTPTVFFSLEMPARMLLIRTAAIHSVTPTYVVEQQLRYENRSRAVERVVQDFPHLAIVDDTGVGFRQMGSILDELEDTWGVPVKAIIIDYLELLRPPLGTEGGTASVDTISRRLKEFARERDLVVMVLHQLSMTSARRGTSNKERVIDMGHLPVTRNDARYGGDTAADYTVGVYRPALDPTLPQDEKLVRRNEFRMQLLKTRAGSELDFYGHKYHLDLDSMKIFTTTTDPRLDLGDF
ncbi:MAG: hypothetical protein D6746_07500 [Bacteroidetes bacterium]|nr:MAG: hypothetical protein D6746_07500 [Bacteroidota bacterium]